MSSASQCDSKRSDPRGHLVQQLRRQLGHWGALPAKEAAVFSSGAAAIDRLLPGGGLRHGMLVEWLGGEWSRAEERKSRRAEERKSEDYCSTALPLYCSSSAVTLSLLGAREACREGGELVVIDRRRTFYPPAAAAWGIDLNRLLVVRPRTARDELWAAVESLRSPAVAAVWAAVEQLDHRAFRCLQLAAQAGRTLGLLLRPASVRGQPSWADVRLAAGSREQGAGGRGDEGLRMRDERWRGIFNPSSFIPHPSSFCRSMQVHVLRLRGGRAGGWAALEIDDATYTVREVTSQHVTYPLPVVSKLADPASRSTSARA